MNSGAKLWTKLFALACAVSLFSACSGDASTENVGLSQSALESVSQVPVPMLTPSATTSTWDGSFVDLIVADAWASCGLDEDMSIAEADYFAGDTDSYKDPYYRALLDKISSMMAAWANDHPEDESEGILLWKHYRFDSEYNRDRVTGEPKGIDLGSRDMSAYRLDLPADVALKRLANQTVMIAAMNLCIAQGVRSLVLGGDMLRLSEMEQVQSLEVVRERAQIAMLQYSAIFNVLGFTGSPPNPMSGLHVVAYLQEWLAAEPRPVLSLWAADFATAIQLHLTTTLELGELFVRNAASRSPRGGRAASESEEEWGPGSWRQRLMALLHGGDPLATEDNSSPWQNMVGARLPSSTVFQGFDFPWLSWPTQSYLPHFRSGTDDPHVIQFFSLVHAKGLLRIKVSDVDSNAEWMHRSLEARLRTDDCKEVLVDGESSECRTFALNDIPPWTESGESTANDAYTLFTTFGITKEHAVAAARLLEEYETHGPMPIHLVGDVHEVDDDTFVEPDAALVPRRMGEVAELFSNLAPYSIPDNVVSNVELLHFGTVGSGEELQFYFSGDDQGLSALSPYVESMRVLGATTALATVREVLRRLNRIVVPESLDEALAPIRPAVEKVVDSAIGRLSATLSPVTEPITYNWAPYGFPELGTRREIIQVSSFDEFAVFHPDFAFTLDADPTNPFFQATGGTQFELVAVRNDPYAYQLALSPSSRRPSDGAGIAQIVGATGVPHASATVADGRLLSTIVIPIDLSTYSYEPIDKWTLIVVRSDGAESSYLPVMVIATLPNPFNQWDPSLPLAARTLSYALAAGGRLGVLAAQAWAVQFSNPSKPAYDGFGLPSRYLPVADATAFGAQPGDSAMTYFLRNAQEAAAQATQAVQTAIDSTFRSAEASLQSQAAQARSELVLQQESRRFCGAAAETNGCDFDIARVDLFPGAWTQLPGVWDGEPLSVPLYCRALTGFFGSAPPNRNLDCMAYLRLSSALSSVPLAEPVRREIHSRSVPTFSAFSGGEVQAILIDQWAAVQQMRNGAQQLETAKKAAAARLTAADATMQHLLALLQVARTQLSGLTQGQEITVERMNRAGNVVLKQCDAALKYLGTFTRKYSGGSRESASTELSIDADAVIEGIAAENTGARANAQNWAQLTQLEAACLDARNAFDAARLEALNNDVMTLIQEHQAEAAQYAFEAAKGNAIAEGLEGVAAIHRYAAEIDGAVAEATRAVARLARAREEADLAVARQELESTIASRGAQLSMSLVRQYHQYDWWRARSLLDTARRYAVTARRAIEVQYVTDLDRLVNAEPFVAPPSTWARDIYRYDLSLPSAVGLYAGEAVQGAQNPNQVLDYVGNLQRFVQGFAVARPVSAAVDNDVVTIPGPGATVVVDGQVVADPGRTAWSVFCPAESTCTSPGQGGWCPAVTGIPLSQTCVWTTETSPPTYLALTRARVSFYLDPWGQAVGRTAPRRYEARVNARWGRFALNLVGNGIRDCSLSMSPNDCQANQYLRYDLHHQGPSLAIGATRQWRELEIPSAQVESGKGSTLGEFLDVSQNAWGKPFIEATARSELVGRPFNGSYVLEILGDASTRFDRIESVQILHGSSYWVLQN